jgi:hypothetical protein
VKDFDVIRAERVNADRTFRLAGEEFTFRPTIGADRLAKYEDDMFDAATAAASVAIADGYILDLLEPGQEKKWQAARSRNGDEAISFTDMREVINHVHEVISGRPTERPSGSTGGPSASGTGSTGGSPSKARTSKS